MATAQQIIVDQFVLLINNNANLNTRVIASSSAAGILRVTTRGADTPKADYLAAGSNVTGAGTFANKAPTGSPKYAEVWFSWTLAPGDTVKLNVGTTVQGVDLTYQLPLNTTVDPGGFDHTTIGTGGNGVAVGGSGIGSAQHRRLVVMECGSASASFGSLFALDPQDATGIAIPTFRVTNALPTAGSAVGEALFVTATRSGFVWDGNGWRDVTASPIRSFPNDNVLQQDVVEAVGVYAVATDTGNMYIRTPGGWRRIGISEFATYADMLAYNAPPGAQAGCYDLGVQFVRVEDQGVRSWVPTTQMIKTQAEILATQNIRGLFAVATDTGSTYVNDGTKWIEDPIEHYPTEVGLLASPPTVGHIAWADDTAQVFVGVTAGWRRLQGPNVAVGSTTPTGNAAGDLWLRPGTGVPAQNYLEVYDGAAWQSATPAQPVGTIIQSMLTEAQFNASLGPIEAAKWCLADGRNVAGSIYAQITNNNVVPDLRGAFIRGAGQNSNGESNWNGGAIGSSHNDTTRGPRRTALTGTTNSTGAHRHLDGNFTIRATNRYGNIVEGGTSLILSNTGTTFGPREQSYTSTDGDHTHTVTINGGGDAETAPVHVSLNVFIRIN